MVADASFFNDFVDTVPGRWIWTVKGMVGGVLYNSDGTQASDQSGVGTMGYNYAGPGMLYDMEKNAFYERQPHASWTLNTTTYRWDPPITRPTTDVYWDEAAHQADNTKGWTDY